MEGLIPLQESLKMTPFGVEALLMTKVGVIGIMEAVELLLSQNYQPKRTMYLALGHDEEIGV